MNSEVLEDCVKLENSILTEGSPHVPVFSLLLSWIKALSTDKKTNTSRYLTRIHLNETLFHKSDSEQTGFPN